MTQVFELTKLDPDSFEHMINMLALKVIGNGVTGFGPGGDGGRDGFFEGTAPYPSVTDQWAGSWYIQSKFHRPHLSDNPQNWLVSQITNELKEFSQPQSRRKWPTNWIVATNIEPSGYPETGAFDRARELVKKERPQLAERFHIWGGRKVLDYLNDFPQVYEYYGHFLTPGHILKLMYDGMRDSHADFNAVLRHFIVAQFDEQLHTKLEQAGSTTDNRPGIHQLFTDIPFVSHPAGSRGLAAEQLAKTIAFVHKDPSFALDVPNWKEWTHHPSRARIWFVKGGPGQGKSTLTQFVCQIQRAALLLEPNAPPATDLQVKLAREMQASTASGTQWPLVPRIPVHIELRDFAQWFGQRDTKSACGVLTYLTDRLTKFVEQTVLPGTLLRMFGASRWLFVFDGLDEVPADIKDGVSKQVTKFVNDTLVGSKCDAVIVCTSRPQGYSGQFAALDSANLELSKLSPEQALACAAPVLKIERSVEDASNYYKILKEALNSPAIREIMTTPLQAHIMAVVVRDGSKPPERKWQLYTKFYNVIKQREANHSLPKPSLARLLQEGDTLLKAIHNRLGFELHKRAETKGGASAFLTRVEFEEISRETVMELHEDKVEETVAILMEATTERLVLVNTPENGNQVKFDIRPLQEFFSAEYIYESVDTEIFSRRIRQIADDSHWREVMHFLLSALVENGRQAELAIAVQVLNEINGSATDESSRLLNRRIAIGSLISGRLLEEGVLDQDKRVRNRFSDCIEPLLGSCEVVDALVEVRGVQTLSWLLSLLIRQLTEKTESENLGAAVILANIVPDGNQHIDYIQRYLLNSSPSYRATVFHLLTERDLEEKPLPKWVVRLLVGAKIAPSWFKLTRLGVEAVDTLLASARDQIPAAARDLGIEAPVASLCQYILVDFEGPFSDRGARVRSTQNLFNILEVSHYEPHGELDYKLFSDEVWRGLSETTGYLQACYRIFRLASQPSRANFDALLDALDGDPKNASLITEDVFAWLPSEYIAELAPQASWRIGLQPHLLGTFQGCPCHITFSAGYEAMEEKWKGKWAYFLEMMPTTAIYILTEERFSRRDPLFPEVMRKKANQLALINGLEKTATAAALLTGLWGKLLKSVPKYRDRLRSVIKGCGDVTRNSSYSVREITPFHISLPDEAPLLPHIINLISQRVSHGRYRTIEADGAEQVFLPGKCVAEYIIDPSYLAAISFDENHSHSLRGAATMMYILHPGAHIDQLRRCIEILPSFYHSDDAYWFVRAAGVALAKPISDRNSSAERAMAEVLQSSRTEFIARETVQPIIEMWRQVSRAPVTNSADPTIWRF